MKKNDSEKKVEFFCCAKCGATTKIEKNSINPHDHWGRKWFAEDVLCEKCTFRKPLEKELSKWKNAKIREEQEKSERCGTSNDGMRSEWSEGAKYWAVVTPRPNTPRYDYSTIELFASHDRAKCEKFLADGLAAAEKALEKVVGEKSPRCRKK